MKFLDQARSYIRSGDNCTPEPVSWSNRMIHILRRTGGVRRLIHRHANRLEGQYWPAGSLG